MTTHNPYAAPNAVTLAPGALQNLAGQHYVPLGWRTALAAICVLGMTMFDVAMRVLELELGPDLKVAGGADLVKVALFGLVGLAVMVLSLGGWVFVSVWIHRAASNLRGLGRYGMAFSPAGCVGWFFVPFANLWKPAQAMGEIWRASDPEADQGSWFTSKGTSLVGIWWSAWMMCSFVSCASLVTRDIPSSSAAIGLASCAFRGIAAVALVQLMRGIASRQAQAAARLGA